jgi:LuxR family maltose regulon positive regulatory protein
MANALAEAREPGLLVLDDYHHTKGAADEAVAFLLAHLPAALHLVIITRDDPGLPLARLRARGELAEIREADLRFTEEEAVLFFADTMRLDVAPQELATLSQKTEGWAAGLQLAAIAVAHGGSEAITAFDGSHRHVLDYLLDEVLATRSEAMREFLLATSILTRLCAPLCTALTGKQDARDVLDELERANLFLIALDGDREWYRYHHLFAEALQSELRRRRPDQTLELHRRASDWFAASLMHDEAIHHALEAGDLERAVPLLEHVWPQMDEAYQSERWFGWMESVPHGIVRQRPLLSLGYGWALLNRGDLAAAERWLSVTEQRVGEHGAGLETLVEDRDQIEASRLRALPGAIAAARAYRALTEGAGDEAIEHARRALRLPSDSREASHRQGRALMGIAYWMRGELAQADEILSYFMERMIVSGNFTDAMIAFVVAEIRVAQGRVADARAACDQLLAAAARHGGAVALAMGDIHRALAEIAVEQHDLETATVQFQRAEELSPHVALPNWEFRLRQTQAHLHAAAGDFGQAFDLLSEADSAYTPAPIPIVRPIGAQQARLNLAMGRLDLAERWMDDVRLSTTDSGGFLREYEQCTCVRVLTALGEREASDRLLENLQHAAEEGRRYGSVIEVLVLRFLATREPGPLHAALLRAQEEQLARPFLEEGELLLPGLREAREHGVAPRFASRLIRATEERRDRPPDPPTLTEALIEPLSDREQEVLEMLATDLNGPQIAGELIISLNTLRTHTKSIYGKLGVNSRLSAVRRARELSLL